MKDAVQLGAVELPTIEQSNVGRLSTIKATPTRLTSSSIGKGRPPSASSSASAPVAPRAPSAGLRVGGRITTKARVDDVNGAPLSSRTDPGPSKSSKYSRFPGKTLKARTRASGVTSQGNSVGNGNNSVGVNGPVTPVKKTVGATVSLLNGTLDTPSPPPAVPVHKRIPSAGSGDRRVTSGGPRRVVKSSYTKTTLAAVAPELKPSASSSSLKAPAVGGGLSRNSSFSASGKDLLQSASAKMLSGVWGGVGGKSTTSVNAGMGDMLPGDQEETREQAVCVSLLKGGYAQSFVEFFLLTHDVPEEGDVRAMNADGEEYEWGGIPGLDAGAAGGERVAGRAGMTRPLEGDEFEYVQNLYITAERAGRVGNHDAVYEAYASMARFFASIGDHRSALHFHEMGLDIASRTRNQVAIADGYHASGIAHEALDDVKSAIECFEQYKRAADVPEEAEDGLPDAEGHQRVARMALIRAYSTLASEKESRGLWEESVAAQRQAKVYAQECGEEQAEGAADLAIGEGLEKLGEFDAAIEAYSSYSDIATKRMHDPVGAGQAMAALARTYERMGELDQAEVYLERYLAIAQDTDQPRAAAAACSSLGMIANHRGDYGGAVEFFEESYRIAQELGDKELLDPARISLGVARGNVLMSPFMSLVREPRLDALLSWKNNRTGEFGGTANEANSAAQDRSARNIDARLTSARLASAELNLKKQQSISGGDEVERAVAADDLVEQAASLADNDGEDDIGEEAEEGGVVETEEPVIMGGGDEDVNMEQEKHEAEVEPEVEEVEQEQEQEQEQTVAPTGPSPTEMLALETVASALEEAQTAILNEAEAEAEVAVPTGPSPSELLAIQTVESALEEAQTAILKEAQEKEEADFEAEEAAPEAGEAAPEVEEAAPGVEEAAPEAEEAAPEAEEAAPETEEAAPEAEEAASEAEEAAPEAEEAAPEAEEATSEAEEAAPGVEEAAPEAEETAPEAEETASEVEEAAPETEEAAPEVEAEAEAEVEVEATPESEQATPEADDPEVEEAAPEVELELEVTPEAEEATPEAVGDNISETGDAPELEAQGGEGSEEVEDNQASSPKPASPDRT